MVAGGSPEPGADGGALGGGGAGVLGGGDGRGLLDELEDDDAVVLLRVGSATVAGSSSRSGKNTSAPIPAITSTPTTVRTAARFRSLLGAGRPYPPGWP
jgi:hypothetical protein